MFIRLSNRIASKLEEYQIISGTNRALYEYGLRQMFTTILNFISEETGEKIYQKYYVPNSDKEIILKPFTEQEAEENENFVYETLKHPIYNDRVISNILFEELNAYYAGDKSAEDTANLIQNRVQIYLSEIS